MSKPICHNFLPNHYSFSDTGSQKIVLFVLALLSLGGCSLGLVSHFHMIPSQFQWYGWGLFSVTVIYPLSAGIAHQIHKRLNPVQTGSNNANTEQTTFQAALSKVAQEGTGILSSGERFVYVKVQDKEFDDLFNSLKADIPNLTKPFQPGKQVGAHITVVSGSDNLQQETLSQMQREINAVERIIPFQILGYKVVNTPGNPHVKAFHVLQIRSPELENLRTQYSLPPKQSVGSENIEFHVTIGEEPNN